MFYDKSNDSLPEPSKLSEIDVSQGEFADAGDSFVTHVDFDIDAYRRKMNKMAVRRNVSIPEWLNTAADEAHLNVSRILQEALMDKLGITQ